MPLATQVTDRTDAPPGAGRRLLADLPASGSFLSLSEHRNRYPRPPAPRNRPLTALIDEIDHAGLRGRGGAGFPTAVKMRSVAGGRGTPFVVGNGTEGEPASYKDKLLLTSLPHLVIDGALLAAAAVGADQVVIGIEHTSRLALDAMSRALSERRRSEPTPIPVEIAETPP